MMDLPTPGTSTSVAKARAAVKSTDSEKVEVITISDDEDEDDVDRLPVQQQQLKYNITGTYDQCQQLFSASCQVKLTRCQIPANFAAGPAKPAVKYEDSSDDDEEEDDANLAAVSKVTVKEEDSSEDEDHDNSSPSRGNEETCQTADVASSSNMIVPKLDKSSTGSSSDEEVAEVLAAEKQQRKKKRGRKPKSTVRALDCPICGKTLCSKRYVKEHILKIHTENKKNQGAGQVYKCEDCERSFNVLSTFNSHKRDNPNGICVIKDRAKRNRQEKIEKIAKKLLEEEPRPKGRWTCKICQKSMKAPANYVEHMRSHAGDRRFKCDQCGKSFVRPKTLSDHQKIHTGIKGIGCIFCGKRFHQEQNLFRHLRIHTEEKPYFCVVTGCGASFRHSESLKSHQRLIHLKRC